MNHLGDVFTDVVLIEAFLTERFRAQFALNYLGDVFTDVVLTEAFLMERFLGAIGMASPLLAPLDRNGQRRLPCWFRPPSPRRVGRIHSGMIDSFLQTKMLSVWGRLRH